MTSARRPQEETRASRHEWWPEGREKPRAPFEVWLAAQSGFPRRHARAKRPTAAALSNANAPGSGTLSPAAAGNPALGAAVAAGSKMDVPPAPTVKLEPAGRALAAAATSVPASTYVPPV